MNASPAKARTTMRNRRVTQSYAPIVPVYPPPTRVRSKGAIEFPDGTYRTIHNGEVYEAVGDRYRLLTRYGLTSWCHESELEKV